MWPRRLMLLCSLMLPLVLPMPAHALDRLRVAVGPYLPTPSDTRAAYEPFAKYIGKKLGVEVEFTTTNEWAGIAVALGSNRVDVAWMGPWGYVLANKEGGAEAIATVKYRGSPTYQALIIARPELKFEKFPHDAKGLRLALSDVGGTSGWLIPTWYFKGQGIDPKSFFVYRDGSSHTANTVAVANGHLDLASDYDRGRNFLIERGTIGADATKIVWSYTLPNDAIAVRNGLDPSIRKRLQDLLVGMTDEEALANLPKDYTGFVKADHATYASIEEAGRSIGRLK